MFNGVGACGARIAGISFEGVRESDGGAPVVQLCYVRVACGGGGHGDREGREGVPHRECIHRGAHHCDGDHGRGIRSFPLAGREICSLRAVRAVDRLFAHRICRDHGRIYCRESNFGDQEKVKNPEKG